MFNDLLEFDKEIVETNTPIASISLGKKISKSIQSGIRRNNIGSAGKEKNSLFNKNVSDNRSALILVPKHINSLLKQSTQNRTEYILYLDQIVYSFGLLPKVSTKAPAANLDCDW